MRRERDQIRIQSDPSQRRAGFSIPRARKGLTACAGESNEIAARRPGTGHAIGCRRSRGSSQSTASGQSARRWLGLLIVCLLASGGPSWAVDAPRLDLNRATETELAALPGIGKVRAQAIAKRRAELRFARPEELLGVPGIGPGIYAGLRDRIEVSSEPDPAEK
jgi:hypothetical protein